jgi:ankyrin repeat protein
MIDADKILRLINRNDWKTILSHLKDGTIDPLVTIRNGNNISHMASLGNNESIIKFYLSHNKSALSKSNDDGLNAYHIMAKYGYNGLLSKAIDVTPESINLVDLNGNSISHYLVENKDDQFEKFIKNDHIDLEIVNNVGDTLLTRLIALTTDDDDIYFKRIKLLLDKGININHPNTNYPLIKAIVERKPYVAELLIKSGANIDVKDGDYLTPFLLAVYNELETIVQLLIDNGAEINYVGAEGDNNPLSITLMKGNDKISDILLENGFDTKRYNRDMNTPLHIAFMANGKLKPSTISKLLFYGDLNAQNINGETPLHLFLKKYDWLTYDKILETKKMDIFIKDKNGKSPIDYVPDDKFVKFIDLVTTGLINSRDSIVQCDDVQKMNCFNRTKEYILKNKISYISDGEQDDITLITSPVVTRGRFNSDILHNVIYTTIILERNSNVGVPFQYYDKAKAITVLASLESTNFLMNLPEENMMSELINIYHEYFFEIAPYLILWKGKNLFYVDKDIEFYTLKCLNSKSVRFIFFKLTLLASANGTHANIIIFDKESGILERFEPYGEIPYLETENLDEMITDKIGTFLSRYLKAKNMKLTYYSPKDLFGGVSFQIISNDMNSKVKKMGDPVGFCLAWTLWYLEMRIKNPNVDPKTLISKSVSKIKGTEKTDYQNQLFIDFIRNYAASLDDEKNKIIVSAGLSEQYVYNLQFSQKDNEKIIGHVNKRITDAMNKRIKS